MRDVVSNINFFSKVTANSSGELEFHPGSSKAGDYVDLSFEMDTLVVLSAAPHPLDPAKNYHPGEVKLTVFVTSPEVAATCTKIAENARGLQNTERFYAYGGEA
jgi:uncharacterized protein YcgI (DUF1989 family)